MTAWRLEGDVVVFESLRLRLHRIARSHWRAAGVLRSWGAIALFRKGETLHAPCADDEALWLGAWLADDETTSASVELSNPATGCSALITPPGGFQIASLRDSSGISHSSDPPQPLVRSAGALSIQLHCGPARSAAALMLHSFADWAALAGRPLPDALTGPPPLPPRLG
jgi:hypothetical protein